MSTSPNPWLIWIFPLCFYFLQFIFRASPNVMAAVLMKDFGIWSTEFSLLAAGYYYTYAVMQLPMGILVDTYGPKRILRLAILVCLSGGIIFTLASGTSTAVLGRCLIGLGASGSFVGTLRLISLWFSPRHIPLLVGLTICIGKIGGVMANAPLSYMLECFSWRQTMGIMLGIGGIIALGLWRYVEDRPQAPGGTQKSLTQSLKDLRVLFTQKPYLSIAIFGGLMYVPLSVFADTWSVSFLAQRNNIPLMTAAQLNSLFLVGTASGSYLVPYFASRPGQCYAQYMRFSALWSAGMHAILIWTAWGADSLTMTGILMFATGFSFSGQMLIFSYAFSFAPENVRGTLTGFINTIVMFSGVCLQPIVGIILDSLGTFNLTAYQYALGILPLCLGLAFVIAWRFPPTRRAGGFPTKGKSGSIS